MSLAKEQVKITSNYNPSSNTNKMYDPCLHLIIPRVFSNINEARITKIFTELNIGKIKSIDIVPVPKTKEDSKSKDKSKNYNKVFIHFSSWFTNETARQAKKTLLEGKELKIVYDEPWFWKVSVYKNNNKSNSSHCKTQNQNQKPNKPIAKPKPMIVFEDIIRKPNPPVRTSAHGGSVSYIDYDRIRETIETQDKILKEYMENVEVKSVDVKRKLSF